MKLENTKGEIFYGMHFYPGVAQYDSPEGSFKIFINETTIRQMGPTFAGKPIFVQHVDKVTPHLDTLRTEADGWVIESFFNAADGKNWVKFIVTSEEGLRAIRHGYRLSNAYEADNFGAGGVWNGVDFEKEVLGGEFEHLAIVEDPRYDESVIMTPQEFKAYNDEKSNELKRFANSKDKKESKMGLKLFKRTKIENSVDLESTEVELPLSKKTVSITKAVEGYDKFLNMNGYANGDHMVKVGNDEMSVNDLVKKHMESCNALDEMKKNAASKEGGEPGKGTEEDGKDAGGVNVDNDEESLAEDCEDVGDRGGDKHLDNEDDEDEDGKKGDKKDMKNELEKARLIIAKDKARRLKNAQLAHLKNSREEEVARIDLPMDQVARGKARYGSN